MVGRFGQGEAFPRNAAVSGEVGFRVQDDPVRLDVAALAAAVGEGRIFGGDRDAEARRRWLPRPKPPLGQGEFQEISLHEADIDGRLEDGRMLGPWSLLTSRASGYRSRRPRRRRRSPGRPRNRPAKRGPSDCRAEFRPTSVRRRARIRARRSCRCRRHPGPAATDRSASPAECP